MLGECASPAQLATLWRCVLAGEDARVQEKAWTAFLDILARTGQLALASRVGSHADRRPSGTAPLADACRDRDPLAAQPPRKDLLVPAEEMLVQAQLELGKWSPAVPLLRDLLARRPARLN